MQKVKKIKLNKKSATRKIRGTLQLAVTKISPADAVNQSVVWASSNKNVATVDGKGKVTARKAGTAVITCTSKDGSKVKAQCQIKVKK